MPVRNYIFTLVLVLPSWLHAQSNLTAGEYFFDLDPGIGNATPLPAFTASGNIDFTFSSAASGLTTGMHILGIRVKDISNTWSIPSFLSVYVINNDPLVQGTIVGAEYFFDSDPGIGNGTSVPSITPGTVIDVSYLANSSGLPVGMHILGVRTIDNGGLWSTPSFTSFYVDLNRSINKLEYYIDTDPGVGSATPIVISPEQTSIDMDIVFSTASLAVGAHTIGIRAGRVDDNWSSTQSAAFNVCTYANADFTTNIACTPGPTTFTDNSTSTLAGDVYTWDFDNNGSVDATTTGNTTFTYPSSGTYTATLTISRSGCNDIHSASVEVKAMPVANAGPDQNICPDNTTLAATTPAVGETGSWSILSGGGTITNSTNPGSAFTAIASYTNTLQWTVTNTVAGCSSNDQVIVISNRPITAAGVTANASLGQTVNTNVQSTATINPGDVLTTTIISLPKKGTASLESNGTINYTPNAGTVGKDTVVFELCNQCTKCSTNNLIVTILNNAPVITPQPISVGATQNVSIDLLSLISDPNNNIDLSSLAITQQPISGAPASIDASYNLTINYTGIIFSGTDQLTVQVCDVEVICSSNILSIEVDLPADPPITVYNAISPNGDGKHDFLEILNITAYPNNHIYIFNRWGDRIFESQGYDNDKIKFNGTGNKGGGNELPSGTYFYSLDLGNGKDRTQGYLVLKR